MKGKGKGGEGCSAPTGAVDPAVEAGRGKRRAVRGACVWASGHLFFSTLSTVGNEYQVNGSLLQITCTGCRSYKPYVNS